MSMQSDIARKFNLPERQSKLVLMLREGGLKDEQVYCICRSADVSRFMIGCDKCEGWFHGDCINVTEQQATKIRKFYCQKCRLKNPGLSIKYKISKTEHHEKHESKHHSDKKHSHHKKSDKKSSRCGECEACYVREDCGRCEPCKDKPKFGGPGKLGQKCKKRQCINFYRLAKKNKDHGRSDHTYISSAKHGSSKNSVIFTPIPHEEKPEPKQQTAALSKHKEKSPVPTPRVHVEQTPRAQVDQTSRAQVEQTPRVHVEQTPRARTEHAPRAQVEQTPRAQVEHAPRAQVEQTPRAQAEHIPRAHVESSKPERPTLPQESQQRRKIYEEDSDWKPGVLKSRNSDDDGGESKKKKVWHKEVKIPKKSESKAGRKRKVRKVSSSDSDEAPCAIDVRPRQCFGPQCAEFSKPGSKYCSDKCGLKLAEARIYSVLPQRIQEWHMRPCVSTERDRKKLENLREQQQKARQELGILDEKHKELDAFLERVKAMPPIPAGEADEDDSEYAYIYCVTCGHEVASKKALRHMRHCYNKLESQMSFGSMYKTRIEGNNMFCDFFNPLTLTYCKRLRVMCPEHLKEPKVSSTEVCGFPLVVNIFKESNEVCRVAKKICTRHYLWEKLRRATIDMERVRQCLKLDELVEQERTTRNAMTNRAGVLGLMLHSTYNHPLLDKLQKQRQLSQGQPVPNKRPEAEQKTRQPLVSTSKQESNQGKILVYPKNTAVDSSSTTQRSSLSEKNTLSVVQVNVDKPGGVKVIHMEQKSDHPYHRHPFHPDKPKPRIIKGPSVKGSQKYVVDQGVVGEGSNKRTHDHLYSSSPVEFKRHQDHMYYAANKRFK